MNDQFQDYGMRPAALTVARSNSSFREFIRNFDSINVESRIEFAPFEVDVERSAMQKQFRQDMTAAYTKLMYKQELEEMSATLGPIQPSFDVIALGRLYKKMVANIFSAPICIVGIMAKEFASAQHIGQFLQQYPVLQSATSVLVDFDNVYMFYFAFPSSAMHALSTDAAFAHLAKPRIARFLYTFDVTIDILRRKQADVCFALQDLELPVLLTVLIIDELFDASDVRMWVKWKIAEKIKHFRQRVSCRKPKVRLVHNE